MTNPQLSAAKVKVRFYEAMGDLPIQNFLMELIQFHRNEVSRNAMERTFTDYDIGDDYFHLIEKTIEGLIRDDRRQKQWTPINIIFKLSRILTYHYSNSEVVKKNKNDRALTVHYKRVWIQMLLQSYKPFTMDYIQELFLELKERMEL
ncbi:hypothetical protein GEMRC1_010163 [Eukaryota sp. GEM-RC1]